MKLNSSSWSFHPSFLSLGPYGRQAAQGPGLDIASGAGRWQFSVTVLPWCGPALGLVGRQPLAKTLLRNWPPEFSFTVGWSVTKTENWFKKSCTNQKSDSESFLLEFLPNALLLLFHPLPFPHRRRLGLCLRQEY